MYKVGEFTMLNEKYSEIKSIVESKLSCSAHNLDHVMRVCELCVEISKYENNVDLEILIPAALLHDIARVQESEDQTGMIDHAILGGDMAYEILNELGYDEKKSIAIRYCIQTHRFRTGCEPESIESKILFDADKLDAIGSVGVARCLMLSGQFGQRLKSIDNIEKYLKENTTENGRLKDVSKHSPFIEYEIKFKKIPSKLYTKRAKKLGNSRIKYMDEFFKTLNLEIKGKL